MEIGHQKGGSEKEGRRMVEGRMKIKPRVKKKMNAAIATVLAE
jgi:hypothetical protein